MWFRRDLRLADNHALAAAVAGGDRVIPLFVLDDVLWERSGANRRRFLAGCLASLHDDLGGATRDPSRRSGRRDSPARRRARRRQRLPCPGRGRVRPPPRRRGGGRACRRRAGARRGRQPVRGTCRHDPHGRRRHVQGLQRLPPSLAPAAPASDRAAPVRRADDRWRAVGPSPEPTGRHRRPARAGRVRSPPDARPFHGVTRRHLRRDPRRPRRRSNQPPVAVPQVRLPPPPPAPPAPRRAQPVARHVRRRAGVARLLRRRARLLAGVGVALVEPGDGRHEGRPRQAGGRALRRLVRRPHGLPDRRRRHAPTGRRGVDAQPGAHDHRQLPRQGPPRRLDHGGAVLHGATRGRRPAVEQPRLAVGRRHRHRRRALPPHLQPDPAVGAVRHRRRLHPPLGARARRSRRPARPRPVDCAGRPTAPVSAADRRPRHGAGRGARSLPAVRSR